MTVKVTFILKNGTEINRIQTKTLNSPDKFEKTAQKRDPGCHERPFKYLFLWKPAGPWIRDRVCKYQD